MVKQGTKHYIIIGPDSTTKFVFEVKQNPQKHCGQPTGIYPTNYDSLCVAIISGCFGLRSGRSLGKKRYGATQLLQYIATTESNEFAQLYAYDPKHTSHKTSDEDRWRHVPEYGLWHAYANKIRLPHLPEFTTTPNLWITTLEEPMWARTNTDPYYSDAVSWKPTPRRIYANWKPVNASRNWWQLSLAVSVPTYSFTISNNETVLRSDPHTLRRPNSIRCPHYTTNTPRC